MRLTSHHTIAAHTRAQQRWKRELQQRKIDRAEYESLVRGERELASFERPAALRESPYSPRKL